MKLKNLYAIIQQFHVFDSILGNIAPFRAYIAKATFSQERTMHLSILAAFQGLGMTVGPAIQAMLTPLQCSPNDAEDFPYFSFDMFSSAG